MIPKETRCFWEVEDIKCTDKVFIDINYNSKIYKANISISNKRTRLFWYKDLSEILIDSFPNYKNYFEVEKKKKSPILMRFLKINKFSYVLELIDLHVLNENLNGQIIDNPDLNNIKEGKAQYKNTKYYERSCKNRLEAIKFHGTKCNICGFDFQEAYGIRGQNFIEIHHINPLSELQEETIINPKEDLFPVCANCHRIIHCKRSETLSINEMKKLINKKYIKY